MDKDSILTLERHNVGHGPERDQVEPSAQVEVWKGACFEQSVAKFENDSNAAKVAESGILCGLRVYDRNAIGQSAFRFVMIEHDHLRTARADVSDFNTGAGPTI